MNTKKNFCLQKWGWRYNKIGGWNSGQTLWIYCKWGKWKSSVYNEKSQKQIEQDKQNAVTDAKREIASMAVDAAEKIIGKKLTDSDDEELISDIIDRM